jgi:branched-chain amino acid transport system permease protein
MEIYLPWFGGPTGIDYIPRPMFLGTEIGDLRFGLLILAFVVLIVFLCFKINHSWIGLAWECIRLDEETAQIMGINVGRYKLLAFVVGGLFSGLGGALYSTFFRHICPEDFSFIPSLGILATVLAGGTGTILGPVAGAILFTLFPEFF